MRTHPSSLWLSAALVLTGGFFFSQCNLIEQAGPGPDPDPARPTRVPATIVFERDIKPMMEIECLQCHNSVDAKKNAGLNLETRKLAMTTGRVPPVIRPGEPEKSLFIKVLELDSNHPTSMPPAPDKIWGARMKILQKWIKQGAKWPDNVRLVRPQDWPE